MFDAWEEQRIAANPRLRFRAAGFIRCARYMHGLSESARRVQRNSTNLVAGLIETVGTQRRRRRNASEGWEGVAVTSRLSLT